MSGLKLSWCLCVAPAAILATPARAASVTFLNSDGATLGNWKGVYGQDGNVIAQHSVIVPSYSAFNTAGNINLHVVDIWATDPRVLLKQYYSIALYCAAYQNQNRSNTVKFLDTATGAVLDSRALTNYGGGVYLVYSYTGNVWFRIVNNNPGPYNPTALVNAFFWGGGSPAPPPPSSGTTPPTVLIATPAAGNVSGTVSVTANVSDNVGVTSVQYLDGSNLGTAQTAAPYSFSWNTASVSSGNHTLTAIARDAAGNSAISAGVSVNVNNVGSVQYQIDGGNLGSALSAQPYTYAWNTNTTSNGSHTLTAIARDAAGNTTTSAGVTVNVSNTATATGNNATFVGTDNTTLGDWKGVYGQDGNVIAQSSVVVPSYASFDTGGDINLKLIDLWATDPTALLKYQPSYSPNERVKSEFYTPYAMTFKIGSNDGQKHRLALYFANFENFTASGNNNLGLLNIKDPVTGQFLDARTIVAASAPTYVVYDYTGTILISVGFISPSAGPYAVVSGFFWGGIGPIPSGTPSDTNPLVVSISTPSASSTVSGTVLSANATDDKGVASVQFLMDTDNVGGPIAAPAYTRTIDTTILANGAHTVKALATGTSGNTAMASVVVNVSNTTTAPPPTSGNSVTSLGQDNNTKGNWKGVESYTAPSYSIFNPINVNQLIVTDNTDDARAPLKMYYSYSPTERFMSHWHNRYTMDFQVTASDGQAHRIALGGVYLVYNYSGNITFRIVNNWDGDRSHPNGTVSAFYWGGSGMPQ
jgi:hypothetical protein